MNAAKLGLGTVQFGIDYGISNALGRPSGEEVGHILATAAATGIRVLDTASLYGTAEQVLGEVPGGRADFRVVTKTLQYADSVDITAAEAADLRATFLRSLERLRRDRVAGLLIHRADDLLKPGADRLWRAMADLRDEGLVERIGASFYTGAQIDAVLDRFQPELVQVPINVLDQRLLHGGQLDRLHARGIEVHARSAFLQGLLLMPAAKVPETLPGGRAAVARFQAAAAAAGQTPLAAALGFVLGLPQVGTVLVGVASACQLAEIISICGSARPPEAAHILASDDERLVNPSLWPKT